MEEHLSMHTHSSLTPDGDRWPLLISEASYKGACAHCSHAHTHDTSHVRAGSCLTYRTDLAMCLCLPLGRCHVLVRCVRLLSTGVLCASSGSHSEDCDTVRLTDLQYRQVIELAIFVMQSLALSGWAKRTSIPRWLLQR